MTTSKNVGTPYEPPFRKKLVIYREPWEQSDNSVPLENRWDLPIDQEPHTKTYTKTSLEALQKKHAKIKQHWKDSKYRKMVDELFAKKILRQTFIIDQAICLAMGSLSFKCGDEGDQKSRLDGDQSMGQFVFFEYCIELLSKYEFNVLSNHDIWTVYMLIRCRDEIHDPKCVFSRSRFH